jgi:hypothetical protein
MLNRILLIFLILTSVNSFAGIGDNKGYWIISQNEYNALFSKGKDVRLRRYVVVSSFDKKYKDIFKTTDEQALLAKFSYMLYKNKASRIEKYIKNCNDSLDINNLIKGLYYFAKKQYNLAIPHLEKLKNKEYRFLQLLLIADCRSEMLYYQNKHQTIFEAYQVAFDSTDSEQNKTIIHIRIKYIKYRYSL